MEWTLSIGEETNQRNDVKEEIVFSKKGIFCVKETDFKIVKDVSDIERSDLPLKNSSLKILTTNNTISTKILSVFDIENLSISFAVISENGVSHLSSYKIETILSRCDSENKPLSKIAKNIKCENFILRKNHTKIFLIKEKENYFVILSSANPKISDYTENYIIYNSEKIFNYFTSIFKKI